MLAIQDKGFFNDVHLLKCEVHLTEYELFKRNPSFRKLSDIIFCAKKYINQEPGAKVSYIFLNHYLSCALVSLFVIAGFSWRACIYVSCVWVHVRLSKHTVMEHVGSISVKDCSKCRVANPVVCDVHTLFNV